MLGRNLAFNRLKHFLAHCLFQVKQMRILHVEDPFSIEERAEKKADIRQIFKPPMFRRGFLNHNFIFIIL